MAEHGVYAGSQRGKACRYEKEFYAVQEWDHN